VIETTPLPVAKARQPGRKRRLPEVLTELLHRATLASRKAAKTALSGRLKAGSPGAQQVPHPSREAAQRGRAMRIKLGKMPAPDLEPEEWVANKMSGKSRRL
jgi:hypothetical protein